jgi:hypothetical protein
MKPAKQLEDMDHVLIHLELDRHSFLHCLIYKKSNNNNNNSIKHVMNQVSHLHHCCTLPLISHFSYLSSLHILQHFSSLCYT